MATGLTFAARIRRYSARAVRLARPSPARLPMPRVSVQAKATAAMPALPAARIRATVPRPATRLRTSTSESATTESKNANPAKNDEGALVGNCLGPGHGRGGTERALAKATGVAWDREEEAPCSGSALRHQRGLLTRRLGAQIVNAITLQQWCIPNAVFKQTRSKKSHDEFRKRIQGGYHG
jgi:hypothetical protein